MTPAIVAGEKRRKWTGRERAGIGDRLSAVVSGEDVAYDSSPLAVSLTDGRFGSDPGEDPGIARFGEVVVIDVGHVSEIGHLLAIM